MLFGNCKWSKCWKQQQTVFEYQIVWIIRCNSALYLILRGIIRSLHLGKSDLQNLKQTSELSSSIKIANCISLSSLKFLYWCDSQSRSIYGWSLWLHYKKYQVSQKQFLARWLASPLEAFFGTHCRVKVKWI